MHLCLSIEVILTSILDARRNLQRKTFRRDTAKNDHKTTKETELIALPSDIYKMHNYTCTELDLLVFKVKNLEENTQDEYAHILQRSIILLGIRIITVEFLFSPESCW